MKKLLLLGAVAAFGFGTLSAEPVKRVRWISEISPVTTLTDGGTYLIYDASKILTGSDSDRTAWRKVNSGTVKVIGDHSTSSEAGEVNYDEYVFQAVQDGDNWQFKHLGTNKFIPGVTAETKTINVSDTPGSWTVTFNEEHSAFRVKSTACNQYWDGSNDATFSMVTWGAPNDNSSHWYQFFAVTDDMLPTEYPTVFKANESDTETAMSSFWLYDDETLDTSAYPLYDIATESDKIVCTLKSGEEIRFYNERKGTWMRVNDTNGGHALGQIVNDNPAERTVFRFIPAGDEAYAIYYPAAKKFIGNIVGTNSTTPLVGLTLTPQLYYYGKQEAPSNYMSWIGTNNNKTGYNFFNDLQGNGVCGYSWDDPGSKWVIVSNLNQFKENWALRQQLVAAIPNYEAVLELLGETDEEGLKAWAEAYDFGGDVNVAVSEENLVKINKILNATLRGEIEMAKRTGNALAQTGLFSEAAVTEWNTFIGNLPTESTQEVLASINAAIDNMVANVLPASINIGSFTHKGHFIGTDGTQPYRSEQNNSRAWTIVPTDGVGFYLFNEYANGYIKHPAADTNAFATFVSSTEAASIYTLDLADSSEMTFGIKTLDENIPENRTYLHSNTTQPIQRWSTGGASSWYLTVVDETVASTEHLNGAIAAGTSITPNTELGGYNVANPAALAEAVVAAQALTSEATSEARREAAAAIYEQLSTLSMNMPLEGRFYRFKGQSSNKYLSSEVNADGRLPMIENGGNLPSTVWYYTADHKLVALSDGLVMGKFAAADSEKNGWKTVLSTDGNAGTVTFSESGLSGYYNINLNPDVTNRYIYEADPVVNAGNGDGNGYRWTIENVTYLPIAYDYDVENEYTTVCSPVELNRTESYSAGRVNAYIGTIKGDKLEKHAIDGNIPANTPVLLQALTTVGMENGCIYLEIKYPANDVNALAEGDVETETVNHLQGHYLAQAKEEGTSYFTVAKPADVAGFHSHDAEATYIPGFAAHLAVPAEDAEASYEITVPSTTEIAEISGVDNGGEVYYDLQGRRVVAPAKGGIYVTGNGKKVKF